MPVQNNPDLLPTDPFVERHVGSSLPQLEAMLRKLGYASLDALTDTAVPRAIQLRRTLSLGPPRSEAALLRELAELADLNQQVRSFIGMGYYGCITPAVIQRNLLENPGWYTQYTPYQAEIAQGRLEALLNFQTMVSDLTALPLSNASLLDEATAAAEAMTMCRAITRGKRQGFFVDQGCHPQTAAVAATRAQPLGIRIHSGSAERIDFAELGLFGVLLQYPTTEGRIEDYSELCRRAHDAGVLVAVATDLLALTLLRPPGEFGADVAVGSTQRFGLPLGYGGPHAAFLATREEYRRQVPGRIVGVSRDVEGRRAYRLALQTREQHIRRERATSNICTAQVLLAVAASMYAVHHGPDGLRRIASRVQGYTATLGEGLRRLGHTVSPERCFDTLRIEPRHPDRSAILEAAHEARINLREYPDGSLGISLDETTTREEVATLLRVFAPTGTRPPELAELGDAAPPGYAPPFARQSPYLTHPVFERYHTEHELLRYLHRLESRDLSLTTSMIPLGSCTMKLSAAAIMTPLSLSGFTNIHPFAPAAQTAGYERLIGQLCDWLAEITGFAAVSVQPNSGAQGEYTGLLVIRAHHAKRGEAHRNVCLIPSSAHGTNPASAVLAGFEVMVVGCDSSGNVDVDDLVRKAREHSDRLGALMLTYPSTHGVFESTVREICAAVHEHGGQVYLDGANLNAQVGLCRPGDYGADVCHLNLHKTFAIPHGGGGPGVGPIAVAEHLAPFLPGHPLRPGGPHAVGPVSAAPFGSPNVLPIAWAYIALMSASGLTRASQVAILNANYLRQRLADHYPILFVGEQGLVAHEFIVDARGFKRSAGVDVDDIAKRLMDFGFHAPTMSWPVPGTLMVEPTESESKAELDRFCDALLTIRDEIRAIEQGQVSVEDSPLKHAPHCALDVICDSWPRRYSREQAAFPVPHTREHKYWPPVARIDNAWGDRNLVCRRTDDDL